MQIDLMQIDLTPRTILDSRPLATARSLTNGILLCCTAWLMGVALGPTAAADGLIDDTLATSREEGRPLMVLVTSPTCQPCQVQKSILEQDPAVQARIGQFIRLDLVVNAREFHEFAQRYPVAMRMVPRIYLVRPDGQLLNTCEGLVKAPALATMLDQVSTQSGRAMDTAKRTEVAQAVDNARRLADSGSVLKALNHLQDDCFDNSFARVAFEGRVLRRQLMNEIDRSVERVEQRLLDPQKRLDAAIDLAHFYLGTENLPALRSRARQLFEKYRDGGSTREAVLQATDLVRGEVFEARDDWQRAHAAYQRIATQYPDSEAARRACDRIVETRDKMPAVVGSESMTLMASSWEPQAVGETSAEQQAERYLFLAKLYLTEYPDEAMKYARRVIAIAPGSAEAKQAKVLLDRNSLLPIGRYLQQPRSS
ncbi:MAG: thioredoxin family protein [Pirellulaceae bacterium]|nr:thioredoxin family protein [Planctomycetales bacterium]